MAKMELPPENVEVIATIDPVLEDPLELLLQGIEAELETKGWDQRPSFYFIVHLPPHEGYFPEPECGALGAVEAPMPEVWYENPAVYTAGLVQALREEPEVRRIAKLLVPDEYLGILVSFEGWTVPMPADESSAEWRAWDVARRFGRFHAHPDRLEERITWAYTTQGRELYIMRQRFKFPEMCRPGENGMKFVSGRAPDGMRDLLNEFAAIAKET